MKFSLLTLFALCTAFSNSQTLDFNNVSALAGINGMIFQDVTNQSAGYEIPKGSGINAIYTTSLWCAAVDDTGGLHVAGMRFGQAGQDFFQGPYSTTNSYQDANYQAHYSNSVWTVTKGEIQAHISGYSIPGYILTANIANWPANGLGGVGVAQNLAPFVDMNNNGIYEPMQGDYPDIRGDKAIYQIMNDAQGVHSETGGLQLGIEVHTMLYQFTSTDYKDNTTFIHFRVFNRGADDYDNFKLALFSDFDLGNAFDDFIGCDSTQNLMYIYNGDNNDESSGPAAGYGVDPPAVGIMSLSQSIKHFASFTNAAPFPFTDPSSAAQYYNYMNGMWANGTPWTYGGNGSGGVTNTNYLFPGNPNDPNAWSEVSVGNPSGDRRGVITFEDENLASGDYVCYDFAVLYSRETGNNNLQNVNSLIALAATAQSDFDAVSTFNCDLVTLGTEELIANKIALYPNPSNGNFVLSFGDTQLSGKVIIRDLSGRIVFENIIENSSAMKIEMNENKGVYLLSIHTDKGMITKKIAIQ